MADRVYTEDRTVRRGASVVAWIALILAAAALTLAWIAYNRTGTDLEDQIQQQINSSLNNADEAAQEGAEAVESGADAVDAGPDGVDEDDTDVQQTN